MLWETMIAICYESFGMYELQLFRAKKTIPFTLISKIDEHRYHYN